jgi:carboxy-cis,cis-muconate cyclase
MNVATAATSSYVHVQPPPYNSLTSPSYGVPSGASRYLFSAGGPTGEVHYIDSDTGALGSKAQEIVFLQEPSSEALAVADKTRKALRYGAHSFDFGKEEIAYVADLGRNAILSYRMVQKGKGDGEARMQLVGETKSPREGDGPRHVVPSPCGRWVFSVTEHTSYVDVYKVSPSSSSTSFEAREQEHAQRLTYVQSLDILPAGADRGQYRGDTVRLSPDGKAVLATTRGKTSATKGIVRAWRLLPTEHAAASEERGGRRAVQEEPLCTFETETSGGKANAIEFAARYGDHQFTQAEQEQGATQGMDLAVLTDDEQGYIWILEWDGQDLKQVARTKLPGKASGRVGEGEEEEEGASHAVWIS